jgi:hypothetical protein
MAVIFDARGNEYVGQLDAINGTSIVDGRPANQNLNLLNAETFFDVNGHSTCMIDVRGTFVGTAVFEATVDGTNYIAVPAYNLLTGAYVPQVTAPGTVATNCAGFRRIRVRCSAYTSGTLIVAMRGSTADFAIIVERIPATLTVTATGAAAAAVTLTLAAPGAGMYHYIDSIKIDHFATALLTAAATPVLVTSTNLPGSPVINFRADAAPQGTLTTSIIQCGMPLRSTAANTATTVVCPATTAVIWRATAVYRIGA